MILWLYLCKKLHATVYLQDPSFNLSGESTELEYSYHHIQEFTSDTNKYESALQKSTVSGGGNDYESGLDGLLQTIVCKGKIGSI